MQAHLALRPRRHVRCVTVSCLVDSQQQRTLGRAACGATAPVFVCGHARRQSSKRPRTRRACWASSPTCILPGARLGPGAAGGAGESGSAGFSDSPAAPGQSRVAALYLPSSRLCGLAWPVPTRRSTNRSRLPDFLARRMRGGTTSATAAGQTFTVQNPCGTTPVLSNASNTPACPFLAATQNEPRRPGRRIRRIRLAFQRPRAGGRSAAPLRLRGPCMLQVFARCGHYPRA